MNKLLKFLLATLVIFSTVLMIAGESASANISTYVYITKSKSALHEGMNLKTDKISSVNAGQYVLAKPVSKSWFYVASKKGYVLAKNLKRQEGQFKMIATEKHMPIFSSASSTSERLALAFAKSIVTSYGAPKAGWSYVKYGNTFGFIQYDVLKQAKSKSKSIENSRGAVLRVKASNTVKSFATIPFGAKVDVYSQFAGWAFVTSKYGNGYIYAKDLVKNKEIEKTPVISGKKIALTFDDGPSASVTPQVLKTLKKYNVKATFFVLGQQVERYPKLAKQIVNEGHQIAGHSWNHRDLSKLSVATVKADLTKTNNAIQKATGVSPTIYRPPYGALNNSMRKQISLRPILWTVDTLDWKHRSPKQTLQYVKNGAKSGGKILMHDIHQATATALEDVIVYLKNEGYAFVTVDGL